MNGIWGNTEIPDITTVAAINVFRSAMKDIQKALATVRKCSGSSDVSDMM